MSVLINDISSSSKQINISVYYHNSNNLLYSLQKNIDKKDTQFIGKADIDSGYTKLPNGLTIQWGKFYVSQFNSSSFSTSFPIPFENKCLNVIALPSTYVQPGNGSINVYTKSFNKNNVTFTFGNWEFYPSGYIYYRAIGY